MSTVLLLALAIHVAQPVDDESILSPARGPSLGDLDERRATPDYDGVTPEWAPSPAVWPARVVLFPLFVVTELGLRQPIGFATRGVESLSTAPHKRKDPKAREHSIGVSPLVTIANGMQPTFGLSVLVDRLFVDWHAMRAVVTSDFQRNLFAGVLNRFTSSDVAEIDLRAGYERRNDLVFYGVGAATARGDETRFERRRSFIEVEVAHRAALHVDGRVALELADNNFGCSRRRRDICGDDDLEHTADDRFTGGSRGQAAYLSTGYAMMRLKALVALDSRVRGGSATGARLDLFGRYGEAIGERADGVRFVRYGGEAAGFVDVTGNRRRVLALRLYVELMEHARDHAVPFTELVSLGGADVLHGFLRGRFQGESAVVVTADYSWPIWSLLDANLFYEMGNVFDRHLADFDVKKLRGSYGLALRTNGAGDVSFQLLVAAGTKTWSAEPDEFRFIAGTNVGF